MKTTQTNSSAQTTQTNQSHQTTQSPIASSLFSNRGLYARWETFQGKLVCRWFKQPD
ncbi:hypothetical protein [Stenomitos frigidus]|uniref:hypothetical protein n=1 Tax=Stenomitos frigidus TaxID=1886765 RepID=UPI0015E68E17|nr:hypothetical protein [Stenomitos frigidus]